ncbi:MAG: histidine--tRNA ligase [Candidatus Kaelpia aquatica]|nr:histidine--tRNA ligase [Candidatus Kaelpia aquatica]
MNYRRLRGTEDIYDPEVEIWHRIEAIAEDIFKLYGYKDIRTPLIEYTELFKRSIGEATDIVEKEIYQFQDNSKRLISLRPEATASIVRAYLENSLYQKPGVAKFYYSGAMFRAERPQKGRKRQFHQLGVEAIGSLYPEMDLEVMLLAQKFFDLLGIKDYIIELNTLGCREDKKKISDYLRKEIKGGLQDLCSSCQERYNRNIFRVLDCKNPACREKISRLNIDIKNAVCEDCIRHYQDLKGMLNLLGLKYVENKYLVRGLDYYTRTVFEISHPGLGAQNTIAAGGRYDNLVEDMGGSSTGAVGFALGVERLIMTLDEKAGYFNNLDVFIILQDRSLIDQALLKLVEFRDNGISADMDYEGKSLKSQMRLANEKNSKFVLILGEEEDKQGFYSLKNMEAHQQQKIKKTDILDVVKGGLNC